MEDADNPFTKIVELYQTDDVAKKMDEVGPLDNTSQFGNLKNNQV